ncbi:FecR family protein [Mariniphaga anaerophila]|uniref:FecR family protein n=1 Tax=Mariniphaga anaerophila TaxID=1484053 RepID=A0A1M5ELZ6_9BACT|nr:FecR domain-containing protein [Mariniphaga anaerophila]SHF80227.1 FecR family protein [Mariniphaga anaerophila]
MKTNNSIEKPKYELLQKYCCHQANIVEKEAVENWASQSEQNKDELEEIKVLLEKTDDYFLLNKFNSDAAWKKTKQRIQPKITPALTRRTIISKFYRYAAVIVVAILAGSAAFYFAQKNQGSVNYSEIISDKNQVVNEYVLPDGTLVTLNSNSKLEFPTKFNNNVREVTITGEAFFDVAHNPETPFIINAGNARVQVLGTSFNVNAYPESKTVEVVVKTGTVKVTGNKNTNISDLKEITLKPGEKGTFINSIGKLEKSTNANQNYLAWKTRILLFNNTPLSEVIFYLNETYHTDIQLKEEYLNDLILTAQFDKKPVEFVLNVIRLTFDLKLEKENNTYILSENRAINK